MQILFLVAGVIVGVLATYIIVSRQSARIKIQLEREKASRLAENSTADQNLKQATERETLLKAELEKQKLAAKDELQQLRKEHKDEMQAQQLATRQDMDKTCTQLREDYEKRLSIATNQSLEQHKAELDSLNKSYQQQMELFKQQLTTATEKLLKDRSEALQSTNTQQMETLFKPIKENIVNMEKSLNDNREANAKNSASFTEAIRNMVERTITLGNQADRLSNALQQKNKAAGNWGELVLSKLLESNGLVQGEHFDIQESLKDENGRTLQNEDTGKRMIPDVVLHLADNREVIIDSKVSLTAFIDYQNAENDEQRNDAAKRHLASVKNHVDELKKKKYQDYIKKPKICADFVIMFVPNDGAVQLAMAEDASLWRNAFDNKVFIASGQTLLAALRIIDLTWINVKQNANTEKIMAEAANLVNRVSLFMERFSKFGESINNLQKSYDEISTSVKGNQSILTTGRKLEELGVKGKKTLEIL